MMKRPAVVAFGVAAAIAVPALLIGTSSASSSHHDRQFSVVSKNAQGTITPPDFGTSPAQDQQAAADAPVVRDGHKVGRSETLLTITRASSTGRSTPRTSPTESRSRWSAVPAATRARRVKSS
jgi:hypothetical protein